MKTLVKVQFYWMILLAAVLFMVSAAIGDDQIEILTEETVQQMTQKPLPLIMISLVVRIWQIREWIPSITKWMMSSLLNANRKLNSSSDNLRRFNQR